MIFSALLLAAATAAPMPTPQSLPTVAIAAPRAHLRVQVAQTEEQRERGLMSVTNLPLHTGMIFIFEKDQNVAFWMKDTLIPLDMVFLGTDGKVRKVFANVPVVDPSLPDTQIPLEEGIARFVIELPAGEAAIDGLKPGVVLKLPHPRP
ncbi:MAG TPA: DUF192 domain-containing protein [Candidatus Baltobacteraceae bacterium]|nr:DUF192 domain-containing protein [Candidatus Baltobacteraceae bacterium]